MIALAATAIDQAPHWSTWFTIVFTAKLVLVIFGILGACWCWVEFWDAMPRRRR